MYRTDIDNSQEHILKSIFSDNNTKIQYFNSNEEIIMTHINQHDLYGNNVMVSNEAMESGQLCLICSDKATGKHYGAYSCDGCKGFFRRSVRKKNNYTCQYNKSCKMDKDKRNQCRYCRLKKCILMGMKKNAVQNERDRISTRRSSFDDVAPNMILSIPQLLQAEQRSVSQIMMQNAKPINPQELLGRLAEVPDVCESMKNQLHCLVMWAKCLPCFMQLTLSEQIAVLKAHAGEILILGVIRRSFQLEEDNMLLLGNNLLISRDSGDKHFAEIACHILDDLFLPLRELQLDEPEFACLKAIVFFDPNVVGVSDTNKEFLRRCRHQIQVDLMSHMNDKQYHRPGRFGELLLLIPDLRLVTQLMVKKVEFVKMSGLAEIDNLLSETLLGNGDGATGASLPLYELSQQPGPPQPQMNHHHPQMGHSGEPSLPSYQPSIHGTDDAASASVTSGQYDLIGTTQYLQQQQQQQHLQQGSVGGADGNSPGSSGLYNISGAFMSNQILMDINPSGGGGGPHNDMTASNFWRSYLPPTSDPLYTVFAGNQHNGVELLQQHHPQMATDTNNNNNTNIANNVNGKLCSMIMNSDGMTTTVLKTEDLLQQHHQQHSQQQQQQQQPHLQQFQNCNNGGGEVTVRYNNASLMNPRISTSISNNPSQDSSHLTVDSLSNLNEHFLINLEQPYSHLLASSSANNNTTNSLDHHTHQSHQILLSKFSQHDSNNSNSNHHNSGHSDISDESSHDFTTTKSNESTFTTITSSNSSSNNNNITSTDNLLILPATSGSNIMSVASITDTINNNSLNKVSKYHNSKQIIENEPN